MERKRTSRTSRSPSRTRRTSASNSASISASLSSSNSFINSPSNESSNEVLVSQSPSRSSRNNRVKTSHVSQPNMNDNIVDNIDNNININGDTIGDNNGDNNAAKGFKKDSSHSHEIEMEFGGPFGTFCIIFGLPIVILLLFYLSNQHNHFTFQHFVSMDFQFQSLPLNWSDLITKKGISLVVSWFGLQVVLERILPGEIAEGVTLRNQSRLKYCMSGHLQLWITLVLLYCAYPSFQYDESAATYQLTSFESFPLYIIYDHYAELAVGSIVLSSVLSVYLYVSSFQPGALLALGGDTGNVVYDFFIGRELNPRIGSLDLKQFCELRPGLIGWLVINLGMVWKQFNVHGSVSLSMLAVTFSQGLYVWDALYQEKAILTTMDITTDGFGYMLAFGDLSWVPFIYSLQTRYLVDHDPHLSLLNVALFLGVQGLGYYIFRSANSEKDAFRRDCNAPEVSHLKFLETKRGTKLITTGWWGAARKINYTGDWLITFSWCLLCGFSSPIPYFQAIYFAILLVHRAIRDDKMCAEKYGADWDEYKSRVPYWFVPGLF